MPRRALFAAASLALLTACTGAAEQPPQGDAPTGTGQTAPGPDSAPGTGVGSPSDTGGAVTTPGGVGTGGSVQAEPPEASGPKTSVPVTGRTPGGLSIPSGTVTQGPVLQGGFYSVSITVSDPVDAYRRIVGQMKGAGFRIDFEEKGPLDPTASLMARGTRAGRLVEVNTRGSFFYIVDAPAP